MQEDISLYYWQEIATDDLLEQDMEDFFVEQCWEESY